MGRKQQNAFEQMKDQILHQLQVAIDKSPKGSLDAPILELIQIINQHNNYVTTSSCSGRIAVFQGRKETCGDIDVNGANNTAKGGTWLLAEHGNVTIQKLMTVLNGITPKNAAGSVVTFKHEPFIMHVQCRDEEAAKELLQFALACGFRESGIVLGNKRTMLGIRTTANLLELPIAEDGHLLLPLNYLDVLLRTANAKFDDNRRRTDIFTAKLKHAFGPALLAALTKKIQSSSFQWSVYNSVPLLLLRTGHTLTKISDDEAILFGGYAKDFTGRSSRLNDISVVKIEEQHQTRPLQPRRLVAEGNIPSKRMYHTCVIYGTSKIVLFGGRRGPMKPLNDVYTFNLDIQVWRKLYPCGDIPSARWGHTSIVAGSKMYIYGGRNHEQVFNDAYMLSGIDGQESLEWKKLDLSCEDQLPHLFSHTAVYHDQKIFLYGGLCSLEGTPTSSECYCWSLDRMQWEKLSTRGERGPGARFGHSALLLKDRFMLISGGVCSSANGQRVLHVMYLDLQDLTWASAPSLPTESNMLLVNHTTIASASEEQVWFCGGAIQCFGFGRCYSDVARLDLKYVPCFVQSVPTGDLEKKNHAASQDKQVLLVDKPNIKQLKVRLEKMNLYDKSRRIRPHPEHSELFAVPILHASMSSQQELELQEYQMEKDAFVPQPADAMKGMNPNQRIQHGISELLKQHNLPAALESTIPEKYERVGDILMIPQGAFDAPEWEPVLLELWQCISKISGSTRIARKAFIATNLKRQSQVQLLYICPSDAPERRSRVDPGWVDIRENGLRYSFDITKVMFSSGNVTEKARMAQIGCQNETIVDFYAGIGYYVLPFLVNGAAKVVTMEWNPDSVEALQHNLAQNGVEDRCTVLAGDNRINYKQLGRIADRVNLGLLPSSEDTWEGAIKVLKAEGGWIHVHANVATYEREAWLERLVQTMERYAEADGRQWQISCEHLERVKSYAPRVDHVVADLYCRRRN